MQACYILSKLDFDTENITCKFSKNFSMHPLSKFYCNRESEAAGSPAPGCIRLIKPFKHLLWINLFRIVDFIPDPDQAFSVSFFQSYSNSICPMIESIFYHILEHSLKSRLISINVQ